MDALDRRAGPADRSGVAGL